MNLQPSILCWNIRGINDSIARNNLRNLVKVHRPTIVFIQETKCQNISDVLMDSIWDSTTHDWIFSPSSGNMGQSGGLITTWKKDMFHIVSKEVHQSWIWIRTRLASIPLLKQNFLNIYAPHNSHFKTKLWSDLQNVINSHYAEPFFLLRDFNTVRSANEVLNCIYRSKDSAIINSFINNNGLWDVPLENFNYTWFGPALKSSKLDRALLHQLGGGTSHWKLKG